jgi:hypothetical protein
MRVLVLIVETSYLLASIAKCFLALPPNSLLISLSLVCSLFLDKTAILASPEYFLISCLLVTFCRDGYFMVGDDGIIVSSLSSWTMMLSMTCVVRCPFPVDFMCESCLSIFIRRLYREGKVANETFLSCGSFFTGVCG